MCAIKIHLHIEKMDRRGTVIGLSCRDVHELLHQDSKKQQKTKQNTLPRKTFPFQKVSA